MHARSCQCMAADGYPLGSCQGFHRAVFDVCEAATGREALLRDVWEFFVGLWDGR